MGAGSGGRVVYMLVAPGEGIALGDELLNVAVIETMVKTTEVSMPSALTTFKRVVAEDIADGF
jgi:hypothetical protein